MQVLCTSKAWQGRPFSLKEDFSACLKKPDTAVSRSNDFVKCQIFSWKAKRNQFLGQVYSHHHHSRAKVNYYLYHRFTCHGLPSLFHQQTMFIGTTILSGRQIGFSVPAHEKIFLLLLFSPIQSLVS